MTALHTGEYLRHYFPIKPTGECDMYRVAIIQNENEALRAGYVDFAPKLKALKTFKDYQFDVYTSTNLDDLFRADGISLERYDSIIVATNATSDAAVLDALVANRKMISDFLLRGRGLFVCSQKKLSIKADADLKDHSASSILPDNYDFHTVERPGIEKSSAEGVIRVVEYSSETALVQSALSLSYHPNKLSTPILNDRAARNDFQAHVYRSHLLPLNRWAYETVLLDDSYESPAVRALLLVNRSTTSGERIVITTIAADWVFHSELLENVISYVTEGIPNVAFINKPGSQSSDYAYLFSSVQLAKLPHVVYENPSGISTTLAKVHNTYIFSPGWSEGEILAFFHGNDAAASGAKERKHRYRRIYFFRDLKGNLALTQLSNYSSIDLLLDNGLLWIDAQFDNRMWGGSFWLTYDVLTMMLDLNVSTSSYLEHVADDFRGHTRGGSYDGVVGATAGLLELVVRLNLSEHESMEQVGFGHEFVYAVYAWLQERVGGYSAHDATMVYVALQKIRRNDIHRTYGVQTNGLESAVCAMWDQKALVVNEEVAVVDLSMRLRALACLGSEVAAVQEGLIALERLKNADGGWQNKRVTAFVLVNLVQSMDHIGSGHLWELSKRLAYDGLNYLRSTFDREEGNWDHDLQVTAKALHGIGLYNRVFKYSTQDFFESVHLKGEELHRSSVVLGAANTMEKMRRQLAEQRVITAELKGEAETRSEELLTARKHAGRLSSTVKRQARALNGTRLIATVTSSLLLGLCLSLFLYHKSVLMALLNELGSVLAIIVSAVVGLLIGAIAQYASKDAPADEPPS